jgi:hypothetical protein
LNDASGRLSRLKAIWRDQVFNDPGLTASTFKLGYAMADFITMRDTAAMYRRRGEIVIFPSQETLRERTHLSLDTIRVGTSQLIGGGHLRRLRRGNQITHSSQYKIVVKESRS